LRLPVSQLPKSRLVEELQMSDLLALIPQGARRAMQLCVRALHRSLHHFILLFLLATAGSSTMLSQQFATVNLSVSDPAGSTMDTGMLTRFTSTDENKATLVSTVPVKRLAAPEEIAHVIAFVASANVSYMTGASLPVDGGMIAD
jgi:NAD(P)-dependent dehydrogenase (short-subunit alcohol dehydrogenase family)